MEDNLGHIVYSVNVLEFVTVAGEYVAFIERSDSIEKDEYLHKIQKLLPLLYLKGCLLPEVESVNDEFVEKFVTEGTWEYYEQIVAKKLGSLNDYPEVFEQSSSFAEELVSSNISENLADIYQDIKDFISAYRIGTTEIMNDALWECKQHFEQYWGQKALNALRAVHNILYNKNQIAGDEDIYPENENDQNSNTKNWIITKMQQQYKKDYDEE